MNDHIEFKFNCSECGPTSLQYDEALGDKATVFCEKCGADFQTTYGSIKDKFLKQSKTIVEDKVKNAFKGAGWKLS